MPQSTGVRIIPPVIPIAFILSGAALHGLHPLHIWTSWIVPATGWAVIALSFLPVGLAMRALKSAGTTADARREATTLVTAGIFRISRNPTYLAMQLLCLGIALASNSLILLALVWPCGTVLCLAVIRREEAFLSRKFGQEYDRYRTTVRRWI